MSPPASVRPADGSPPASPFREDDTLYYNALEDELKREDVELKTKTEFADELLEHLDQLEDLDEWIKSEEPFQNWLDDKMIPMLDHPHLVPASVAPNIKHEELKPFNGATLHQLHQLHAPDTRSLLIEFESVLGEMEHQQTVTAQLQQHSVAPPTPPQSPPYEHQYLATLEPVVAQHQQQQVHFGGYVSAEGGAIQPVQVTNDVARELAVVDELLRSRARDLVEPSSPSSSGCGSVYGGDASCSSSSDDPEWSPGGDEYESGGLYELNGGKARARRSKPYSRAPPEERKTRKKEQNKNAATRYRLKKKAEVEVILEEEREVAKLNEGLEDKIKDVSREIKYLKGLMRDLFRAKGLIQ